VPDETRKAAVFWVGQAASRKAVEGLEALVDDDTADLALRERAVFSLSQQRDAQAVPALIRLAKEHPNPRIRQRALFWLGQRDDPRVLDLFREILSGSSR
jgi:HEAT repeat protein